MTVWFWLPKSKQMNDASIAKQCYGEMQPTLCQGDVGKGSGDTGGHREPWCETMFALLLALLSGLSCGGTSNALSTPNDPVTDGLRTPNRSVCWQHVGTHGHWTEVERCFLCYF